MKLKVNKSLRNFYILIHVFVFPFYYEHTNELLKYVYINYTQLKETFLV